MTWFDEDDFGVIERVGPESISTRFRLAILPVWPIESRYHTVSRSGEGQSIAIPLQTRSVVLGYVRTPLWLAALVLAAPALAEPQRWVGLLAIAIPLAVLAAVLTFIVGRVSRSERARRELLRRVVGLGAPPELLPKKLASDVRVMLDDAWREISDEPWHEAITNDIPSELLVALAEYHNRQALAARARANLVPRA